VKLTTIKTAVVSLPVSTPQKQQPRPQWCRYRCRHLKNNNQYRSTRNSSTPLEALETAPESYDSLLSEYNNNSLLTIIESLEIRFFRNVSVPHIFNLSFFFSEITSNGMKPMRYSPFNTQTIFIFIIWGNKIIAANGRGRKNL
jgi:hypothetical protein